MLSLQGYCPMGCGQTLIVDEKARVVCSWAHCPNPTCVHDILQDEEAEHLVCFRESGFTIQHPLRERAIDLFECDVTDWCRSLDGPPEDCGIYRLVRFDDRWDMVLLMTEEELDRSEE